MLTTLKNLIPKGTSGTGRNKNGIGLSGSAPITGEGYVKGNSRVNSSGNSSGSRGKDGKPKKEFGYSNRRLQDEKTAKREEEALYSQGQQVFLKDNPLATGLAARRTASSQASSGSETSSSSSSSSSTRRRRRRSPMKSGVAQRKTVKLKLTPARKAPGPPSQPPEYKEPSKKWIQENSDLWEKIRLRDAVNRVNASKTRSKRSDAEVAQLRSEIQKKLITAREKFMTEKAFREILTRAKENIISSDIEPLTQKEKDKIDSFLNNMGGGK